jgi:hypothetical protein
MRKGSGNPSGDGPESLLGEHENLIPGNTYKKNCILLDASGMFPKPGMVNAVEEMIKKLKKVWQLREKSLLLTQPLLLLIDDALIIYRYFQSPWHSLPHRHCKFPLHHILLCLLLKHLSASQ